MVIVMAEGKSHDLEEGTLLMVMVMVMMMMMMTRQVAALAPRSSCQY